MLAEDYLTVIISVITAAGIIFSIWRGIHAQKSERKAREIMEKRELEAIEGERNIRFAEMLERFEHDLQQSKEKVRTLKTYTDCHRYSSDFLNILNRFAFLHRTNRIDADILNYSKWAFRYAIAILEWKKKMYNSGQNPYELWEDITWWKNKDGLMPLDPKNLPKLMQDFYHQIEDLEEQWKTNKISESDFIKRKKEITDL